MQCPRCTHKLQTVIEYFTEEKSFLYTKEYYCTNCKSSTIEYFDQRGLFSSEWIDFNG